MKTSHSITLKIPTHNVQTTHCMSGFLSFKGDTKKFDNAPQIELCLALYVAQLLHFLHFKEFVDAAKDVRVPVHHQTHTHGLQVHRGSHGRGSRK